MRNCFWLFIPFITGCTSSRTDTEHKGFFKAYYPFANFVLSVDTGLRLIEVYSDKTIDGGFTRLLDSTHIYGIDRFVNKPGIDTNLIIPAKTMGDPRECFVTVDYFTATSLRIYSSLWIIPQDSVVRYDTSLARTPAFEHAYLDGPPGPLDFGETRTYTEETKNGNRFIKIANRHNNDVTYAGMAGKYWFRLRFIINREDSAMVRKMWEQSYFEK